jgi:putative hydroxymethylpyrimidine transport system substrate-binding protein
MQSLSATNHSVPQRRPKHNFTLPVLASNRRRLREVLEQHRLALHKMIQQPSDPAAVLQLVAAGQSDFGSSYENEMTNAAARDIPVKSVMAIMQEPLNSIISLQESDIEGPEDLAGKKVGYAGQSFGTAVIDTVLREAGEDLSSVEKVNVGLDLRPALISKRVDAIVDAYWNIEAVELPKRASRPT